MFRNQLWADPSPRPTEKLGALAELITLKYALPDIALEEVECYQ